MRERNFNNILADLIKLADSLLEQPKPDNENKLHPNYSLFHKKRTGNFLINLFCRHRSKIEKTFHFTDLLKEVTAERKKKGCEGEYIQKLSPSLDAEFVLFGDLFGAFHSLLRDMEELQRLGIIDGSLKLQKANSYLVFNGNLIDSTPLNRHTLTVALILLVQNPTQVFYIRGSRESNEEWHNYALKQELMHEERGASSEFIPLNSAINDFFNTLPLALYLKIPSSEGADFVRLSHSSQLREADFTPFLLESDSKAVKELQLKDLRYPKKPFLLKLFFKGLDRSFSYRPTTGFELLPSEHETIVCSLLSAPTKACQELYGFYNDSFAIFRPQNWTLHHYTQDIRQQKGFNIEVYNLGSPGHTALAKDKNTILLGCTLDLSKSSSFLGLRLKEGIVLGAAECNQFGGGQILSPIFLDDEYTPHKALRNVQEFLTLYHTNLIFSPLGTPTTEAFLSLAKSKEALILFPYTGASIFRQPDLDHILHFRTSYTNETEALIHYAITNLRIKKFALFYQDDAYGQAGLEGARKAFAKHEIKHWLEISYLRNSPNIKSAAASILEFNPESIIFISTYAPSVSLVHTMTPAHLHNKVLMGISFLTDLFRDFLKSKGLPFIISRVLPDCNKGELEIVGKYQKAMQTYNKSSIYTPDSLEGYVNILFFAEMIKQIPPPITKEKIIQQAPQFKNYPFYGLTLNFDPNTRTFFNRAWVDPGDKEWIEFIP